MSTSLQLYRNVAFFLERQNFYRFKIYSNNILQTCENT